MSKTLPILYSRTSTGATQMWSVEIDKNKFRVLSGQIDGKQVTSEWTVCSGKNIGRANETSPSEQALAEAQSKWDKKAKTGYTTDIKKIDSCTSYVEPMLAKNLKDRLKKIDWKNGVFVQNKFNGNRCVATLEGGSVVLKTRKGELWVSVPHINKDLEKFFAKYPDAVLDGELFNNELRQQLNELAKLVRREKHFDATHFKRAEELVRFYVYDGYIVGDGSLDAEDAYEERKKWIDSELPKLTKYGRVVKTDLVYSMAEVDKIYNTYLADQQEGAIVRVVGSPYENKRSAYLLKYKPVDDAEAVILKLIEGEGNWAGTAKTATIKWSGKTFDATFKGSFEQGAERLNNPKDWVGKTVTFLYNGLTGLGIPNYARIDPDNCWKNDR